jgi:hypothetical protein
MSTGNPCSPDYDNVEDQTGMIKGSELPIPKPRPWFEWFSRRFLAFCFALRNLNRRIFPKRPCEQESFAKYRQQRFD